MNAKQKKARLKRLHNLAEIVAEQKREAERLRLEREFKVERRLRIQQKWKSYRDNQRRVRESLEKNTPKTAIGDW